MLSEFWTGLFITDPEPASRIQGSKRQRIRIRNTGFIRFWNAIPIFISNYIFPFLGVEEAVCALLEQYRVFHEVRGRNLFADR